MQNQVPLETYPIKCSLGIAKLILVDSADSPGVSVYGVWAWDAVNSLSD